MDIIIGILAFVFVLGLIIAIHEWGHFFFARRVNILCREYAFGMGPQLLKTKKGETVYSIRALPIGGFCAIAGEEQEDDPFQGLSKVKLDIEANIIKAFYLNVENTAHDFPIYDIVGYDIYDEKETGNLYMDTSINGEDIHYKVDPQAMIYIDKMEFQIAPYNRTIGSKTKRAQAMVMFGGPLMNFLLALVVFFIAGLMQGFPNVQSSETIVSEAVSMGEDSTPTASYRAGLRSGDVITNLKSGSQNHDISEWKDISTFMDLYKTLGHNNTIEVEYKRSKETRTTNLSPQLMFNNLGFFGEFSFENDNFNGIKVLLIDDIDTEMANNLALDKGDIITSINGVGVSDLNNLYNEIENYSGTEAENMLEFEVLRDGVTKVIEVRPYSKGIMDTQTTIQGGKIPLLNIMMGVGSTTKFDLGQSFVYAGERTLGSFTAVFDTLKLLFGKESVSIKSLSGPVGIFSMTSQIASLGFSNLLNWMGLLSVNVGLLNLFPIPALDGGRLVFLGYEAITKKKPSKKVETALISITMILLLGLMVFVTFNDILNLFK